ncbi:hypothetical protein DSO57_1024456 [Entomophthora muscae]|uniref:Uncharacterized protein n=1 Tax=Entomophthora muscae TaxID=34485 RepID=A0ACC2S4F0_9FUNG|nr:hypothetical protein DSO57_1024456 [Entomophthora muscae]
MLFVATVLGLIAGKVTNPYCSASFPSAVTYKKLEEYDLVSVYLMTCYGNRAPLGESLIGSEELSGPATGWKCSPGGISNTNVTI